MKKNSLIYVAGHSGFIGRRLVKTLEGHGYANILLRRHQDLDLTNQERTDRFLKKLRPEYVFLLAAKAGGIFANSSFPADFIYQNMMIQNNVIHSAHKYGVKKLLFPGSACMYPKHCPQPIKSEYLLRGDIEPTNEPFGLAKISGIKLCQAYNRQHKAKFICVVPATVYGPGDHFNNNGHVIAGLVDKIFKAKLLKKNYVEIWGTGSPKREFIYIDDVVGAFIYLMNNYAGNDIVHIGTQVEISIKQLSKMLKDIIGFKGKIEFDTKKPDGIPRRLLDSSMIIRLGWRPKFSLKEGLTSACNWYKSYKLSKD